MERREHCPPPPPSVEQSCWGLEGMWEVQQIALFWALAPSAIIGQWFRAHGRKNYSVGFHSPRKAALWSSGASPHPFPVWVG